MISEIMKTLLHTEHTSRLLGKQPGKKKKKEEEMKLLYPKFILLLLISH